MQFTETLTDVRGISPHRNETIFVNGRFRVHSMTGLQRYAEELLSRMSGQLRVVEPGRSLTGLAGHAWEQLSLPARVRGGLIWSPCNTGPIGLRRQVVTIHDLFPLEHPEWFTPNFVRCFRAIVPRLIRSVQRIIAVSQFTRASIAAAIPQAEEKTTVIHSGIGPQFCPTASKNAEQAAAEIGLPARTYMLSVSSLEPRKNLGRILEAWEQALPDLPENLWLVLAGKAGNPAVFGSAGAPFESTGAPQRVHFTGYVPDRLLPGLYAGAQAFLFPSLAEGFGFPPLEAMACGTPALVSDTSSLPEVCGSAAYAVDALDVHEIARGIRELALNHDLRANLRLRGLSRARKFQWSFTADRTWGLLETELCRQGQEARV
jgi:glycosyltransferase involved in cell wall biosynthesis